MVEVGLAVALEAAMVAVVGKVEARTGAAVWDWAAVVAMAVVAASGLAAPVAEGRRAVRQLQHR